MQKKPRMSTSFSISIYHLCGCVSLLTSRLGIPVLATVSLITIISGARLALPLLILIGIGLISLIILLVSLNVVRKQVYPVILYLISLSLLYGTTLTSNYLIGSDIHIEYYFARLTQLQGWDYSLAYNMNGSLSVTLLAPYLSTILHIDLLWIFKIIFPLLFAAVPVVLYYIYRQFVSNKAAFLAAAFFVIIPTFFMEVTAITRQQIATLFFVIMLYLILSKDDYIPFKFLKKSHWLRVPFIFLFGMLAIASHYTTGALILAYMGGSVFLIGIMKRIRIPLEIPWSVFTVAAVGVICGGVAYYGTISSGTALHDIIGIMPMGVKIQAMLSQFSPEIAPPQLPPGTVIPAPTPGPIPGSPGYIVPVTPPYSPLMQTALGLDFLNVSLWGQIFRVFQFITQFFLAVGMIYYLLRAYRRHNGGIYASFLVISCGVLVLCVIKPSFSNIINASRFYHYALIIAAPSVLLAAQLLSSKIPKLKIMATGYSVLFAVVVIPYMLFTTGLVFEVTKQTDITQFGMPYNVALSSHRLDLWGNYTPDDEIVRGYITRSDDNPILTDIYGRVFLQETLGYTKSIYLLPRDLENIPDEYHIFLRSENVRTQTLAHWVGPGLKDFVHTDLPSVFESRDIMFQSGNSYYLSEGGK